MQPFSIEGNLFKNNILNGIILMFILTKKTMIRKRVFLLFLFFGFVGSWALGQPSPIVFLNNSCTVNVDTTNGNKTSYYLNHVLDLNYRFVNAGDHVVFVDSNFQNSFITKPKDTCVMVMKFNNFFNEGIGWGNKIIKDSSATIQIPFYYEGKRYYEELTCNYTFGNSLLIEYDPPLMQVSDSVGKYFGNSGLDTIGRKHLAITIKTYYRVKNKTNGPIWCTPDLLGYVDSGIGHREIYQFQRYVLIPPQSEYKIPIEMRMEQRYHFHKQGAFIVFSRETYEIHNIMMVSDFKPKGK